MRPRGLPGRPGAGDRATGRDHGARNHVASIEVAVAPTPVLTAHAAARPTAPVHRAASPPAARTAATPPTSDAPARANARAIESLSAVAKALAAAHEPVGGSRSAASEAVAAADKPVGELRTAVEAPVARFRTAGEHAVADAASAQAIVNASIARVELLVRHRSSQDRPAQLGRPAGSDSSRPAAGRPALASVAVLRIAGAEAGGYTTTSADRIAAPAAAIATRQPGTSTAAAAIPTRQPGTSSAAAIATRQPGTSSAAVAGAPRHDAARPTPRHSGSGATTLLPPTGVGFAASGSAVGGASALFAVLLVISSAVPRLGELIRLRPAWAPPAPLLVLPERPG